MALQLNLGLHGSAPGNPNAATQIPRMEIRELEFGHFPAPEEPDVCSAPLQRRAGSSGAECLSASSEIVGARLQSH
jgi:hypothetical protein